MKGNIVVGQSGGPTAVINSSIAGVYVQAKKLGVEKVYGMVHGIEGFLEDKLCDMDEYFSDPVNVEILKRTPSAFLGSCRFKMPKIEGHEDVYEKVFEIMEKHNLEWLYVPHISNAFSMQGATILWIPLKCCPITRQHTENHRGLWACQRRLTTICLSQTTAQAMAPQQNISPLP